MKIFTTLKKHSAKLAVTTAALTGVGSANAAVDPAISTAITGAGADAAQVVGEFGVAAVVVVAAMWVLGMIFFGGRKGS